MRNSVQILCFLLAGVATNVIIPSVVNKAIFQYAQAQNIRQLQN